MRVLIGGFGIALVAGPLGVLVVWQRMAYFGDALSHSALLGLIISIIAGVTPGVGILISCLGVAIILILLQQNKKITTDTILSILAHTNLSIGLVILAAIGTIRIDLISYLFGDVLAISFTDLYWIWGVDIITILILFLIWRPLLAVTVHEELARVEGILVFPVQLVFVILMAIVISISMKLVGILLIISLLVIPAATARNFAKSPESMAIIASFLGCLAIGLGLLASVLWDTPAGPSIVVAAAGLFVIGSLFSKKVPRF